MLIQPILAVTPIEIDQMTIETKKNGIFIRIRSSEPIPPAEVTGWSNKETGWFYITVHDAKADTAKIEATPLTFPIIKVECTRAGESIQIGLKLRTPIEQFEFYHSSEPPEILALLRFPLSEVLASIDSKTATGIKSADKPYESPRHRALIKGLYFSGGSLTTAGVFAGNNRKGWEIPVGLGLITTAYVIDNFIHGKKDD